MCWQICLYFLLNFSPQMFTSSNSNSFCLHPPQVVLLSHNQIIYLFLFSVSSWSSALERCGHSYFLEIFYSFLRKDIILSSFLFYLLGRSILNSFYFSVSLSSLIYIKNTNAYEISPWISLWFHLYSFLRWPCLFIS